MMDDKYPDVPLPKYTVRYTVFSSAHELSSKRSRLNHSLDVASLCSYSQAGS